MPAVLITPEALIDKPGKNTEVLEAAGLEIRYPKNHQLVRGLTSEEELIAELQGCAAIVAGGEYLTASAIAALPELRVIARCGVGYDRVDVDAATARTIPVTITPTANHEGVAEHALSLLFAVAKTVVKTDRALRAGHWPRTLTRPLRSTTIGLVGLGRVGRSMALRCLALGMKVIASDVAPPRAFVDEHGIELVDRDTLLARADWVSLHCPLTPETRNSFDADCFAKMRFGSAFINTARGEIVVEEDLVAALLSGHLGGAGLDVFQTEPPPPDHPLLGLENVVVTPHLSGLDEISMRNMGIEACECIARLYRGEWPEGAVVNAQLRHGWRW